MRTLIFTHSSGLAHEMGPGHPEQPERLRAIERGLEAERVGALPELDGDVGGGERRRLGEVFPAWRDVPVTHYWRGFVCMNANGVPSVGPLADDPGAGAHGGPDQ